MGNVLAIVVAVETYKDKTITPVRFAEADAREFVDAIKAVGVTTQEVLINQDATKARVESLIKRHLSRLPADDQLIFFYAGHGFALNEHNYVVVHDTLRGDLEGTSVSLRWILGEVNKARCERVAMFLDACASGITTMPEVRGLYSAMSEEELEEFFGKSKYRVCFSSCRSDEQSYSSAPLKHGIWTYHLLEALKGKVRAVLEKGRFLTAASLQGYLSKEVPITLRKTFSNVFVQSPWKYGSENRDFTVADLGDLLKVRNAVKPGYQQLKQILFRETQELSIKSLSGFKKGHFIPQHHGRSAQDFVESISSQDAKDRTDKVFKKIRAHLPYKRKDVTVEAGRIIAPDFEYVTYFELDSEDLETVVQVTELNNILPGVIEDSAFNKVFADDFDEVVFELESPVNVEKFIDSVEEAELDGVDIDFPADSSKCVLEVGDIGVKLTVTKNYVAVSDGYSKSPKELMEVFFKVQRKLLGTPVVALLSSGK
jgi:hypothetical protein